MQPVLRFRLAWKRRSKTGCLSPDLRGPLLKLVVCGLFGCQLPWQHRNHKSLILPRETAQIFCYRPWNCRVTQRINELHTGPKFHPAAWPAGPRPNTPQVGTPSLDKKHLNFSLARKPPIFWPTSAHSSHLEARWSLSTSTGLARKCTSKATCHQPVGLFRPAGLPSASTLQ